MQWKEEDDSGYLPFWLLSALAGLGETHRGHWDLALACPWCWSSLTFVSPSKRKESNRIRRRRKGSLGARQSCFSFKWIIQHPSEQVQSKPALWQMVSNSTLTPWMRVPQRLLESCVYCKRSLMPEETALLVDHFPAKLWQDFQRPLVKLMFKTVRKNACIGKCWKNMCYAKWSSQDIHSTFLLPRFYMGKWGKQLRALPQVSTNAPTWSSCQPVY